MAVATNAARDSGDGNPALTRASRTASGLRSTPTASTPATRASTSVVPAPQKGSTTVRTPLSWKITRAMAGCMRAGQGWNPCVSVSGSSCDAAAHAATSAEASPSRWIGPPICDSDRLIFFVNVTSLGSAARRG